MGNLFYRGVSPAEIKKMKYKEMKYWNKWHEIMSNEEAKATCAKCNRTYDVRKGCGCS
jgi:hypothetical protein